VPVCAAPAAQGALADVSAVRSIAHPAAAADYAVVAASHSAVLNAALSAAVPHLGVHIPDLPLP